MYGYIYLTTNIVNNRKYIGMHKSPKFDESYKGSGKLVSQAFKKYGFDKFETKIIDTADDFDTLCEKEIYWISKYNAVESPLFYNICSGGECNYKINGVSIKKGKKISEQARINTSNAHKGIRPSEETRRKMSESRIGSKNPFYGKTFSEETTKHLSEIRRQKCWINNGSIETTIFKSDLDNYLSDGWRRGRLFARGRATTIES